MRAISRIDEEIGRLADLSRPELVQRWLAIYKVPPPRGIKRPLIERAVAWHMQAKRFGGLSAEHRRVLRSAVQLSRAAEVDRRAPSKLRAGAVQQVRPGARLIRDWHGRTHLVDVTDSGFVWDGRRYASLSSLAREITGTRWSGPRFFGL